MIDCLTREFHTKNFDCCSTAIFVKGGGCHTGSFCNALNLGLAQKCAVSVWKAKVAGPAKVLFADAAVKV